jgi:hypothetical protein
MAEPKTTRIARPSLPTHTIRYSSSELQKQIVAALRRVNLPPGTYTATIAAADAEVVPHGIKLRITLTAGDNK